MKTRNKRVIYTFAFIGIVLLGLYGLLFTSLSKAKGVGYLYVDKDDTIDSIYTKLECFASPYQMGGIKLVSFFVNYEDHIHTGRYEISPNTHSVDLLRRMRGGRQTPVRLVISVSHTSNDLIGKVSKVLEPDSTSFLSTMYDPQTLQELEKDSATLPCLFIPNTYEIYWDITPHEFFLRMKREHDLFWNNERCQKARQMDLSTNEVYILASIVEQESANSKERPVIAGMYLNRLKKGIKLQADPTVKFALNDFSLKRIMHKHLTVDSPYNTYMYKGLPIGPICIPSLNAIESVLNYAHHDYLYMCAKEDFSGTHNFANTYKEHLDNAKKYTDALNSRGIK